MLGQKKACLLANRPSLWQAQQENKMGHPRQENTTKNAEHCKAYRNKSKEKYKLNDALRKMIARQKVTQNPTENQLRLKKEAAAKREWRLQKKLSNQTGKCFINVWEKKTYHANYTQ